jgi:hypothetical protein
VGLGIFADRCQGFKIELGRIENYH